MRFSTKILLAILCTVVCLCCSLGGLTYKTLLPFYQDQFVKRYTTQSNVIRDTFLEIEKITEKVAGNALFALQSFEALHGLPSQEELFNLSQNLHVSNIYLTDKDGYFIRWAHGELSNQQRSIFDHCEAYRAMLQSPSISMEQTPLLPSAGDISKGLFKFFMIANLAKTGIIEVSISWDHIAMVLRDALNQDKMIQSIHLFSAEKNLLATIHASDGFVAKEPTFAEEGVHWRDGVLEIVTAIPQTFATCCECVNKGTSANANHVIYYLSVCIDSSHFKQSLLQIKKNLLLIFLGVCLTSLGGVFLLCHFMLRRLHEMIARVQQLAKGDETIRLATSGSDELALIGREVDKLIFSLQASRTALVEKTRSAAIVELASQVAHDIRSPLAALLVSLDDLIHPTEQTRTLLRKAIFRIHDIANQLLSARRISMIGDQEEITPSPVSLACFVEEVIWEKRSEYRQCTGIQIHFVHHSSLYGSFALLAAEQCRRVLSNLINNAIEAIYPVGNVYIHLHRDNSDLVVQIVDDGPGIPSDVVDKLGQLNNTTKTNGNGIGIAHAMQVIEAHKGQVSISNNKHGSAQVVIRLPAIDPPKWFVSSIYPMQYKQIIVVDDDESMYHLWCQRFSVPIAQGIQVIYFACLDSFQNYVKSKQSMPETMILMDDDFPGQARSGLEVLCALQLTKSAILVTGKSEQSDIVSACLRFGIALLPKHSIERLPVIDGISPDKA